MADADPALSRARASGVRGFIVPGTKLDDAPQAVAIARRNDDVWAAVGFHPHEAKDATMPPSQRSSSSPRIRGRRDRRDRTRYHYMHSPRDTQIVVFEKHIALAKTLDKPIIVHNRDRMTIC